MIAEIESHSEALAVLRHDPKLAAIAHRNLPLALHLKALSDLCEEGDWSEAHRCAEQIAHDTRILGLESAQLKTEN